VPRPPPRGPLAKDIVCAAGGFLFCGGRPWPPRETPFPCWEWPLPRLLALPKLISGPFLCQRLGCFNDAGVLLVTVWWKLPDCDRLGLVRGSAFGSRECGIALPERGLRVALFGLLRTPVASQDARLGESVQALEWAPSF